MHVCEQCACVCGQADERLGLAERRAARGRPTKRAHARTNTDSITRILNKQGKVFARKSVTNKEPLRAADVTQHQVWPRVVSSLRLCSSLTPLIPAHPAPRSQRRRPYQSPRRSVTGPGSGSDPGLGFTGHRASSKTAARIQLLPAPFPVLSILV